MKKESKDPVAEAKKENQRTKAKIDNFKTILACLAIRRDHFLKRSKNPFLPQYLRAKYKIMQVEIEMEMVAKEEFIRIYSERLANVKYLEKVLKPEDQEK